MATRQKTSRWVLFFSFPTRILQIHTADWLALEFPPHVRGLASGCVLLQSAPSIGRGKQHRERKIDTCILYFWLNISIKKRDTFPHFLYFKGFVFIRSAVWLNKVVWWLLWWPDDFFFTVQSAVCSCVRMWTARGKRRDLLIFSVRVGVWTMRCYAEWNEEKEDIGEILQ